MYEKWNQRLIAESENRFGLNVFEPCRSDCSVVQKDMLQRYMNSKADDFEMSVYGKKEHPLIVQ